MREHDGAELLEDRTSRVAPRAGPPGRRGDGFSSALVPIAVLAGVLIVIVGAALLGQPPNHLAIAEGSVPPLATVDPRPVSRPTVDPLNPGANACGTGRIRVDRDTSDAQPVTIEPPRGVPRAAIAFADELDNVHGDVLVADELGSGPIATFHGDDIAQGTGVRAVAFSPAGEELLLLTTHVPATRVAEPTQLCQNLIRMRLAPPGTIHELTDNGGGQRITAEAFSPNGELVAFVQPPVLHVASSDGRGSAIDASGCGADETPTSLVWAADGTSLGVICGDRFAIADLDAKTLSFAEFGNSGESAIAAGSAQGHVFEVALVNDSERLRFVRLEGTRGSWSVVSTSDRRGAWIGSGSTLSPDGRWLLISGYEPPFLDPSTYLVDLRTGHTTSLANVDGLPGNGAVTWIPGTKPTVIRDRASTLVELDLLGGTSVDVGAVPASDYALWLPPG